MSVKPRLNANELLTLRAISFLLSASPMPRLHGYNHPHVLVIMSLLLITSKPCLHANDLLQSLLVAKMSLLPERSIRPPNDSLRLLHLLISSVQCTGIMTITLEPLNTTHGGVISLQHVVKELLMNR